VAQALLTAIGLGLTGLIATALIGLRASSADDIWRHIDFGIFSTFILLLAHSMLMFYLIGKGKAVKDALVENGRGAPDPEYQRQVGRFSAARRPVFSIATLAMAATMTAAILGGGTDVGAVPRIVHAIAAYAAIAANLLAVRVEFGALTQSARIVDDVNRLLGS